MSQVTQAQLTVHAPEGVIVQPVGAALFTFPIGNHHLTGTGVSFPLNPLAQIPLPPGPNVGMVITIRRARLRLLLSVLNRAGHIRGGQRVWIDNAGRDRPQPGPGLEKAKRKAGFHADTFRLQVATLIGRYRQGHILLLPGWHVLAFELTVIAEQGYRQRIMTGRHSP